MKKILPRIKVALPVDKAKALYRGNPRYYGSPFKVIEQHEVYERRDLWALMDAGNLSARDVSTILNKPLKTVQRWAKRASPANSVIPLCFQDWWKLGREVHKKHPTNDVIPLFEEGVQRGYVIMDY